MRQYDTTVEKLSSMIEDRGQTDRVTAPTRAGLRCCLCLATPRYDVHAANDVTEETY